MKYYLVSVAGCAEPSQEQVDSHEAGLRRMCEDKMSGDIREEACAFMCQFDEEGTPNVYPYSGEAVDDMIAILKERITR